MESLHKPKDLAVLQRDRWAVQPFKLLWFVQLFSAASSLFVCCCMRACEGSRCQHEILWLCWQRRQLPKAREKWEEGGTHFSAAEPVQSAPLTKQTEGFSSTGFNDLVLDHQSFFFYSKIITQKLWPGGPGFCGEPQWHQDLLLLHQESFLATPQTISLWHQSCRALFTSCRAPWWNLSSWATGIRCLQYSTIRPWETFPRNQKDTETKTGARQKHPELLYPQ